jgi:hypothetical protein
MLGFLVRNAAAVDEKRGELYPKGHPRSVYFERIELSWNGKPPAGPRSLVLYWDPTTWEFVSSNVASIYIVNETEAIKGLDATWNLTAFTPKLVIGNTTSHSWPEITYQLVTETWHVENYTTTTSTNEPSYVVVFYIVIMNEADVLNRYSVRWATPNPVVASLNDMFENLIFVVLFACGIALVIRYRAERKRMHLSYGLGLIAGGIAAFAWKAFYYWRVSDPFANWIHDYFSYPEMPNVLGFTQNVLAFVSFACLGLSVVFISLTVEKDIQHKKVPFFTYLLVITELTMIGFAFLLKISVELQDAFVVILYVFVGVFIVVAANILFTYIKLSVQTTGSLKRKAILVTISLTLAVVGMVLREFIRPVFIPNMMATVFALVFYRSITVPDSTSDVDLVDPSKKEIAERLGLGLKRPASITEEEISVAKEKRICLVCKGVLSRLNYVCPDCKVMYCARCASALASDENACWGCSAPIDPDKAVNVKRPDQGEIVVEADRARKAGKEEKARKP